jgi:hypothetical protein
MSRLVRTLIVGLLAIASVYAVGYKHDKQYIIYPQLGLSSRDSEKLTGLINEHATGKDKVHIYTRSQQSKPTFWLAVLSEAAFELLNHDQRVCIKIHEYNSPLSWVIRYETFMLTKSLRNPSTPKDRPRTKVPMLRTQLV